MESCRWGRTEGVWAGQRAVRWFSWTGVFPNSGKLELRDEMKVRSAVCLTSVWFNVFQINNCWRLIQDSYSRYFKGCHCPSLCLESTSQLKHSKKSASKEESKSPEVLQKHLVNFPSNYFLHCVQRRFPLFFLSGTASQNVFRNKCSVEN